MASLETVLLETPRGRLELLHSLDLSLTPRRSNRVVLCLHGAHCSAHDFQLLLPLIARAGLPAYALSLRGHGGSWQGSTLTHHLLTGIDDYVEDVAAAIKYVHTQFADSSIVLVGHSLGGGILQYALAKGLGSGSNVAGLVLLVAAGLSGNGSDISKNWQALDKQIKEVEANEVKDSSKTNAKDAGSIFPWFGLASGLDTPLQVRSKFFSAEADDETIDLWLRSCHSRFESLRSAFAIFNRLANADDVLKGIQGLDGGRKVLCVAAGEDPLIPAELVRSNAQEYWDCGVEPADAVIYQLIEGSSHNMMMDVKREEVARLIVKWIDGEIVDPKTNRD